MLINPFMSPFNSILSSLFQWCPKRLSSPSPTNICFICICQCACMCVCVFLFLFFSFHFEKINCMTISYICCTVCVLNMNLFNLFKRLRSKTIIFLFNFVLHHSGLFFSVWAETGDFRDSHSSMAAVANGLETSHLNNFQTSSTSSSALTNRSRDRKDGK